MNDLTDFTNTDDVSDAAIEWVVKTVEWEKHWFAHEIRVECKDDAEDKLIVMLARLIQAHRPELIVDPVDVIVRKLWGESGGGVERIRRAYLAGVEAGKASK